jgi:hypothetical protein
VAVAETEGLGVADTQRLAVGEREGLVEEDRERVTVGEREGLVEEDRERVTVGEALGEREPLAVGVHVITQATVSLLYL